VSVELTEARGLVHVGPGHLRCDRFCVLPVHAVPRSQDQFVGRLAPGVRPHHGESGGGENGSGPPRLDGTPNGCDSRRRPPV
jgi:hypothetical protein